MGGGRWGVACHGEQKTAATRWPQVATRARLGPTHMCRSHVLRPLIKHTAAFLFSPSCSSFFAPLLSTFLLLLLLLSVVLLPGWKSRPAASAAQRPPDELPRPSPVTTAPMTAMTTTACLSVTAARRAIWRRSCAACSSAPSLQRTAMVQC